MGAASKSYAQLVRVKNYLSMYDVAKNNVPIKPWIRRQELERLSWQAAVQDRKGFSSGALVHECIYIFATQIQ